MVCGCEGQDTEGRCHAVLSCRPWPPQQPAAASAPPPLRSAPLQYARLQIRQVEAIRPSALRCRVVGKMGLECNTDAPPHTHTCAPPLT